MSFSFRALPGLFLLLFGLCAQAEVLQRGDHGFVLENRIEVPVPAAQAWQVLVKDIDQWWPSAHTWFGSAGNLSISPVAGGCFCEIDGERQVEHMRIAQALPGKLLRMIGGLGPLQGMGLSGALDWIFENTEDGSRITLRYQVGGYTPEPLGDFVDVVDRVQAQQLGGLGRYLGAQ